MPAQLTAELASRYVQVALANIVTEYPNKLDHLMLSPDDVRGPRALHPVFYGSYDWHSAVHMHWLLVRILRLQPGIPEVADIRACLEQHFSADNLAAELDYLARPGARSFERPYGWGWLLALAAELHALGETDREGMGWSVRMAPLAEAFADRFLEFLPRTDFPVRAGTHGNSAFAMLLALDYADAIQHRALHRAITERANRWYGQDARYPALYEPSGSDFLSAGLVEAALMRRVIDGCSFSDWWERFAPAPDGLASWLRPVAVSDRSDPQISHLDGLNLSRAWCWTLIHPEFQGDMAQAAGRAIDAHLQASLPHAAEGHYVGTHWLASFATLALTASA